jgi:hypothetical protein
VRLAGIARLLWLLLVAVGLVQMHIFGHVSEGHGPGTTVGGEMAAAETHMAVLPGAGIAAVPAQTRSDTGAVPVVASPEDGTTPAEPAHRWDPLAVCLAVLTAAGAAAAAVLLLARLVGFLVGPRLRPVLRGSWRGRGPPVLVPPCGWRIADLSVLRI